MYQLSLLGGRKVQSTPGLEWLGCSGVWQPQSALHQLRDPEKITSINAVHLVFCSHRSRSLSGCLTVCAALSVCSVTVALVNPVDQFHSPCSNSSCGLCQDPACQSAQQPLVHLCCSLFALLCISPGLNLVITETEGWQEGKLFAHSKKLVSTKSFAFINVEKFAKWVDYGKVYKVNQGNILEKHFRISNTGLIIHIYVIIKTVFTMLTLSNGIAHRNQNI